VSLTIRFHFSKIGDHIFIKVLTYKVAAHYSFGGFTFYYGSRSSFQLRRIICWTLQLYIVKYESYLWSWICRFRNRLLLVSDFVDQYRVEETAQWFALGFWGINASDYTSFKGVPENLGMCFLNIRVLM